MDLCFRSHPSDGNRAPPARGAVSTSKKPQHGVIDIYLFPDDTRTSNLSNDSNLDVKFRSEPGREPERKPGFWKPEGRWLKMS